jgi:hypothetical protein
MMRRKWMQVTTAGAGGHGLAWTVMGEAMVSGPASAPLVQDLVLLAQTGSAAAG